MKTWHVFGGEDEVGEVEGGFMVVEETWNGYSFSFEPKYERL